MVKYAISTECSWKAQEMQCRYYWATNSVNRSSDGKKMIIFLWWMYSCIIPVFSWFDRFRPLHFCFLKVNETVFYKPLWLQTLTVTRWWPQCLQPQTVTLWSVFHHLHPHAPLLCQQEAMHIIVPGITEPDLHVHINMVEGKVKVFYFI